MSHPTYAVESAPPPHASRRGLFGLFAGPAAWIAQGLIGWWLGAGICAYWSVESVRVVLGGVGLAALVLCLAGLTSSLQAWRGRRGLTASGNDPVVFTHFAGVFISAAFAVGILWATLNALLITDCGAVR